MVLSTLVLSSLICCSALGQATFEMTNRRDNLGLDAPVFDAEGKALEGPAYQAELFGGRTPDSLLPSGLKVPFLIGLGAGYFRTFETVLITSVPPGDFSWLQVRAWDARLGTNYEEVVSRGLGGYGESTLFYALGGGASPNGDAPGPLLGLQSFRLHSVAGVLMRGISRQGEQVVIEWNPGFTRYQLQQTTALDQPWQVVGSPTSATSYTNSISGSAQFFRVIGLIQ